MTVKTQQLCPLCHSHEIAGFFQDKRREYLRCQICKLIFVPIQFHVTSKAEKAEYDLHQNSPEDMGYRKFLSRLMEPMNHRVAAGSRGLDFGSGPGPTLNLMFQEAGHSMEIYDPIYANDKTILNQPYDFVTATEVVEHFRKPASDLDQLWSLVKPGGILGLMTKLAIDRDAFSRWHYKDDCTHISFYSRDTFTWVANHWKAKLSLIGNDVILFSRPKPSA